MLILRLYLTYFNKILLVQQISFQKFYYLSQSYFSSKTLWVTNKNIGNHFMIFFFSLLKVYSRSGFNEICFLCLTGIGVVKLLSCVVLCLYYPIFIVNTVFYTIWSLYQPLSTSQCLTKLLPSIINHVSYK